MPFETPIRIVEGPDVSSWAETARITRVEFTPSNVLVRHTKEGIGPGAWPGSHVPGWGGPGDPGEIQWTLWAVIRNGGEWVTAGCIEFWPEGNPSMGTHKGGDGNPFSRAAGTWWYSMLGMAGIQPVAGEKVGFFVTQGSQRKKDVHSVTERSNVVWVNLPANDTGHIDFPGATPAVPVTPPPVVPLPPIVNSIVIAEIFERLHAVEQSQRPDDPRVDHLLDRVGKIEHELGDRTSLVHRGAKVQVEGGVRFLGTVTSVGIVVTTGPDAP